MGVAAAIVFSAMGASYGTVNPELGSLQRESYAQIW